MDKLFRTITIVMYTESIASSVSQRAFRTLVSLSSLDVFTDTIEEQKVKNKSAPLPLPVVELSLFCFETSPRHASLYLLHPLVPTSSFIFLRLSFRSYPSSSHSSLEI